jgi:predicted transcriptional regulator
MQIIIDVKWMVAILVLAVVFHHFYYAPIYNLRVQIDEHSWKLREVDVQLKVQGAQINDLMNRLERTNDGFQMLTKKLQEQGAKLKELFEHIEREFSRIHERMGTKPTIGEILWEFGEWVVCTFVRETAQALGYRPNC